MAATKTRTALFTSSSLVASTGNQTSSTVDLSAGYGATIDVSLTNGGTGPTVPAQAQIQVANDSGATLWTNFGGALVGSTVSSQVSYFTIEIPLPCAAARVVAGSNTGQNVTISADLSNVTAL